MRDWSVISIGLRELSGNLNCPYSDKVGGTCNCFWHLFPAQTSHQIRGLLLRGDWRWRLSWPAENNEWRSGGDLSRRWEVLVVSGANYFHRNKASSSSIESLPPSVPPSPDPRRQIGGRMQVVDCHLRVLRRTNSRGTRNLLSLIQVFPGWREIWWIKPRPVFGAGAGTHYCCQLPVHHITTGFKASPLLHTFLSTCIPHSLSSPPTRPHICLQHLSYIVNSWASFSNILLFWHTSSKS